jgi:hypothetical protein
MRKTIDPQKLEKELQRWPKSWAGLDSDIPIGQEIVKAMRPFLSHMLGAKLSYSTINRHAGSLWLLGGEIISQLHHDPGLVDLDGHELLLRCVDEEGGPISRHITTEEEQRRFDSTCRRLHRFLTQQQEIGFHLQTASSIPHATAKLRLKRRIPIR